MKIHLIINDITDKGGAEKIVLLLHEGLRERGLDARIISLRGDTSGINDAYSLGLVSPRDPRAIFRIMKYLKQHASSGDVIHAHLFPSSLYAGLAGKICGFRRSLLFTEHSTSNARRNKMFGKLLDRFIYSLYPRIACISSGTRNALNKWVPTVRQKSVVIENGVELVFDDFIVRSQKQKPVVVSVGRLHPAKDYVTALQAIAQLTDCDFEYWIVGEGNERKNLEVLAQKLGIVNKVRFCGYVAELKSIFLKADIFLMTSKWEGFGLAAVEAMNAGLPIVASDVPGLAEIVGSEVSGGVLVEAGDADGFASAIKMLMDYEKRIVLGREGFQRSLAFSAERMVDGYIEEYNKFAGRLRGRTIEG